jgi:hypothetical protein
MQTRMNRIVVGAVGGLALSLLAMPMARAQGNDRPQPVIVFQAGDAQNIKVNAGDANTARQCAALFSSSHHIAYDDGAWVLWTPNGQQIVVCLPKDVSYDEQQKALSIKGTIGSGTFAGAVVTGKLYLRDDGTMDADIRVVQGTQGGGGSNPFQPRAAAGGFDVTFQLQLELVWIAEQ